MHKRFSILAALLLMVLALPAPAAEVYDVGVGFTTTNVTVTTTTETVAVTSDPAKLRFTNHKILIYGSFQLTTGAGTTAVAATIRRGSTASGTVVGDVVAEEVGAAAGSNEHFFLMVSEDRQNVSEVTYSLTVDQTGATGDGTVLQASIVVMVL